jgi:hypothetical protein
MPAPSSESTCARRSVFHESRASFLGNRLYPGRRRGVASKLVPFLPGDLKRSGRNVLGPFTVANERREALHEANLAIPIDFFKPFGVQNRFFLTARAIAIFTRFLVDNPVHNLHTQTRGYFGPAHRRFVLNPFINTLQVIAIKFRIVASDAQHFRYEAFTLASLQVNEKIQRFRNIAPERFREVRCLTEGRMW